MDTRHGLFLLFSFVVWLTGIILQTLLVSRLKKKPAEELERYLGPGAPAILAGYSLASSKIMLQMIFTRNPLAQSPDLRGLCLALRYCIVLIVLLLGILPFLISIH
jgi:hypothetical protein